jgi:hypothetical protein
MRSILLLKESVIKEVKGTSKLEYVSGYVQALTDISNIDWEDV